ncbi:hypothetical protein BV25DRAFT_1325572 [Artomyces pyxidatus]|uniref:Uncharacterized protein n=1 Tax=Artomyces pyxidatus TaxID=48021 RepID=A0ACB8SQ13_9AGAM|nr:hypothetical protein BV25DRAFT_1325572 [Artomyces pyxidatus]
MHIALDADLFNGPSLSTGNIWVKPSNGTWHNSRLPISILPPEVLARVFSFQAALEPPSSEASPTDWVSTTSKRLGWIKVTHVCQLWRDVALSEPTLWEDVGLEVMPKWAEEMLVRAKSVSVKVRRAAYSDFLRGIWIGSSASAERIVANHHAHIGELTLVGDPESIIPSAELLLASPTPVLVALDLQIRTEWDEENIVSFPPSPHGTPLSPRLRCLTMARCQPSWTHPVPYALTHLEIRLPTAAMRPLSTSSPLHPTPPQITAFNNLVTSLKGMPALETLILEHCIPTRPPVTIGSSSPDSIANLPCLTTLALSGKPGDCLNIVQSVRIPPSAKLGLSCMSYAGQGEDCLILLPFVTAQLRARDKDAPSLRTLSISDAGGFGLSVQVWEEIKPRDQPSVFSYHGVRPSVHFFFAFDSDGEGANSRVVRSICDALPLDDLQSLSVDVQEFWDTWSEQTWGDTFGRCKTLHHLRSAGAAAPSLCDALTRPEKAALDPTKEEKTAGAPRPVLFPNLARLTLQDIAFNGSFALRFLGGLAGRRGKNAGLKHFHGKGCEFGPHYIQVLKSIVPEVELEDWEEDEEEEEEDIEDLSTEDSDT